MTAEPAGGSLPLSGGSLAGSVALVTGASRGLGAAIAAGLAADGATVVLWSRGDATEVVTAIRASGGLVRAHRVDVTSREEVLRAVEAIGRIDILVNNAGVMSRAPFLEIGEAEWRSVIDTDLTGYFIVSQAVARVMAAQGSGAIVHVSSTNDLVPSAGCTAYAAAKGGVAMLTKQMALELGPRGIRTNAVAPGMVETDLNREALSDAAFRAHAESRVPLGRFALPQDVAEAVLYLASDRAKAINGATIRVDGGRTIS